jgi:hypothetical protein
MVLLSGPTGVSQHQRATNEGGKRAFAKQSGLSPQATFYS